MPKKLYFNIDADKRERIYRAAFKEFSNNIFNEASINKIVKNARISRGSFYQYFDDKMDLYFYIIDIIFQEETHAYINKLLNNNDDIFIVFRKLLKFNLELFSNSEYSDFFEKVYLSLNYQISRHLKKSSDYIKEKVLDVNYNKLLDSLPFNDEKYIRELINLLQLNNRDLIIKNIIEELSIEEIMEIYELRVKILKNKD